VRHKKESGCIFGWWDSETQKGEWMYFWLVGHWETNGRVDVFFAGRTVRHKKESGCIFGWWDIKK
jgi:hypothetical protein